MPDPRHTSYSSHTSHPSPATNGRRAINDGPSAARPHPWLLAALICFALAALLIVFAALHGG